jgi:hypothetical protein
MNAVRQDCHDNIFYVIMRAPSFIVFTFFTFVVAIAE